MKEFPGNVMILASAGSGKTFALTDRFVSLLAAGAGPERIAALTFTRKAAGEFFDEILRKLARAAAEPEIAGELARRIDCPELGAGDFGRMLRSVVDAMHRLNLGTLDGFFARVVRAFPLELGLGGDFEILSDQAAKLEKRRALRGLFASSGGMSDSARGEFIEAFKRATFGTEEKSLSAKLDEFIAESLELYLAAPEPGLWGNPEAVWPDGCPWLAAGDGRNEALRDLQGNLPWEALTEGQAERWKDFLAALPGWLPGAPLPREIGYILGNALKVWPEVKEMTVERRKMVLSDGVRSALKRLVSAVVGLELKRRLEMTKGLFDVLAAFESVYDASVRRTGRLAFPDLQRLLQPDSPVRAPLLSRKPGGDARLFIDWRLDARIDHWMLDEFQDTSYGQWSVLKNLVDEAVQDLGGCRTFFYVGDAKQAIFSWRGGDSRLFREIYGHYNAGGAKAIREKRLVRSHRSGPAVIAMVNKVFGAREALRGLLPGSASERWSAEWLDHETAHPEMPDWAELRAAGDKTERYAETLRILQRADPLARGLEAAVLVRTNKAASELAEYLRSEGRLEAVAESDLRVGSDNPFSTAMLALFRAAAHPADTGAWGHLAMTPMMAVLKELGLETKGGLSSGLLREVHADGFERTIDRWLGLLEPHLAAKDEFSRERGRQLAAAGRHFDRTGGRDLAEFAAFAAEFTVRDAESAAVIRVMTVHKAKGLGFDLVILPDLQSQTLAMRRDGPAIQRAADRSVKWVLDLPVQEFWRPDPVLSSYVDEAEADAGYESLCLLYVAMTRAKRALYAITEPPAEKSQSRGFPWLLRETLGGAWSEGDARWYEKIPPSPVEPGETAPEPHAPRMPRASRRPARRPSAARTGVVLPAAPLFSLERASASSLGSAVHSLLAEVEWIGDGSDLERCREAWAARGIDPQAVALASACLRAPEFARIWARPEGRAEVWRERSFEAVLGGAWVTGVFDRAVVVRDRAGAAVSVSIFDFKTDRIGSKAELAAARARHAPQLDLYRQAAAVLAGIGESAVTSEAVFLGARTGGSSDSQGY